MTRKKNNDSFLQTMSSSVDEQFPINFKALEEKASTLLSKGAFGYIQSGAGGEETLKKNTSSFSKLSIVPRFLNDVSNVDTSITLFGRTYPQPFLLAPVGMLKLAHEDAEIATAKAAAEYGIPYIQSTVSSYSIEQIAAETGTSPKWFQLYWSNHKEISYNMVRRAEKAGYEAIVLTVDTVMLGWREEDLRNQFSPLKLGLGKANYETDDVFLAGLPNKDEETIIQGIIDNIHHPTLNWADVAELKKRTSLPILLKGILHPDDALLAIENGIDGIIVSNHGGRQLDGVVSSIDALPAIVSAVNKQIPVLLDSGVRRGADIIKALALGADAVCIGRPYVYGLAAGGQFGVEKVIDGFVQEISVSMALTGVANTWDLRNVTIVNS
ncbi:alpha-hydroxy-acid oxidizing protein [Sporosarcina sp. FA9]|uniref:alpha-hydroxy-acid oxidizing protein n=1 Tax=Sporosarcina sp. FA9 TaxID=3413030 RepID=UPI003F65F719